MSRFSIAALLMLGALLSAGMLWAGVWQLQRGDDKSALMEQRAATLDAVADNALPWPETGVPPYETAVEVSGAFYNSERQILLDNQVSQQPARPVGVHVWTPLLRPDGQVILVNRGWIPASLDRDQVPSWPTPSGPQTVRGIWRALPRAGLASSNVVCDPAAWPVRLNYPQLQQLQCLLGERVADGLLLLGADEPHGFERDWSQVGLPPERHYGYSVQWFALTGALWILIFLLWRRRERQS